MPMTSPNQPRTARLYHAAGSAAVSPSLAAAIVTATLGTYLVVAMVVPRGVVVLAAQAVLAVVPIAAVVVARGRTAIDVRGALGLRVARPRFFVAAIAIGATTWYLNMWIVALLPITERQTRALSELVDRPSLVAALAMFALVPAVCEEIVFRGILARALGGQLRLVFAAVISAAVFSIYHLSLAQAVPTLTLGAVLAVIAIRAGSILPTMIAHALNNAMAIVMSRDELPDLTAWLARHPAAALTSCASATALGLTIALRAPGHAHRDG